MAAVSDQRPAPVRASIESLRRSLAGGIRPITGRVAATLALLAVLASGVLALVLRPSLSGPPARSTAASTAERPDLAKPVKIVGAPPRGGDCAEQAWPYIEHRCLTRSPENAKNGSAEREPVKAAVAPPARENDATTGMGFGDAPPSPGSENSTVRPPGSAVSQPPEAGTQGTSRVPLPIPPGAVPAPPQDPSAAIPRAPGSSPTRVGEAAFMAEPPRRSRRHHRQVRRYWERPPDLRFPF